jgi:hypothetical protein
MVKTSPRLEEIGVYMQTHQVITKDILGSFPSPESYSLRFLTIALTSLLPIVLALYLRKKLTPQADGLSIRKP